ncbi:DUF1361 domain-containing protein [Sungkyunkwania multivorans]|uniref:DUF1361 domain-containing protein n=1 Tax=Sungkyunkwania multivorans TaxID=1173618 RepID=A0ABW3CU56_9FLAO
MKTVFYKYIRSYASYIHFAIFCMALLLIRIKWSQSLYFTFLLWNLFLASIPFVITTFLKANIGWKNNRWLFLGSFVVWLLFLPNAPYILTDLMHLRLRTTMPTWFDALMLSAFSLMGLLLGLASMSQMKQLLRMHFSSFQSSMLMGLVYFLCGYGIYLGRFLRWNSWDVIGHPFELLLSIAESLSNVQAWGITLGFGTLIAICSRFFSINESASH